MLTIGIGTVALAIIGIIFGLMQKMKAGRVANAPLARTGDAASQGKMVAASNGAVAVEGQVLCPQPVIAPVSGQPCLFYEIKCVASWKDGDTGKSKEVAHDRVGAQLTVDDGSGPVRVNLAEGGDFEPEQVKEETKGAGLVGGIVGKGVSFGNYTVSSAPFPIGAKFTVREAILPVVPKLYVCGKVGEAGSPIGAPSFRSLIVSNKSRDELLGAAAKNAKRFLIGGAIAFAAGSGLAVAGQLTSPKAEAAPNTVSVTSNAMPATTVPASSPTGEGDDKQPAVAKALAAPKTATATASGSAPQAKAAASPKPLAQPNPPASSAKAQKTTPAKK